MQIILSSKHAQAGKLFRAHTAKAMAIHRKFAMASASDLLGCGRFKFAIELIDERHQIGSEFENLIL